MEDAQRIPVAIRSPISTLTPHTRLLLTAVAIGTLVASVFVAIGHFGVVMNGANFVCGSPFLGRNTHSSGDVMADSANLCLQDAGIRRIATFVLAGASMVLTQIARPSRPDRPAHAVAGQPSVGRATLALSITGRATEIAAVGIVLVGIVAVIEG